MNWIWLALIAPAIYTIVLFIDKYVVEHKVKDHRGMPIYGAVTATAFGTLVWLFAGQPILSSRNALLVLASGMLSLWGYAFYFKALSKNHASFVIALLQTTPIFTLALAYLFLHERLSGVQLLGFVLVFGAVVALSIERSDEKFRINSALWLILLANILFALANIAIKFTIDLNGFAPILIYESWGLAIGGLVLVVGFPAIRRAFWASFRGVGPKVLSIMFLNEGIFIVSKAITFFAILLGPVALVSLLSSTQVFYGIMYGIALTLIAPRIFHEQTAFSHVWKKILFTLILFGGIYLLT